MVKANRLAVHVLILGAILLYAILANAWIVDDAYITFRSIWNVHHGFGLRWNPSERVQTYTHPLWMLLISGFYGLTHEFFFTTLAVSGALCITAIWLAARIYLRDQPWKVAPFILLLLCSKAFVDYTTSGLENPLSYVLVLLFYGPYLFGNGTPRLLNREARWNVAYYLFVAALAFVNRVDSLLLYMPAAAFLLYRGLRADGRKQLMPALFGISPAVFWTVFSFAYYGFPFPNTYYAKAASIGISASLQWQQGVAYFINSLVWDPPTLVLIGVVITIVVRNSRTRARLCAAGLAIYLFYILKIGAISTHMSGRFFATPYFVAVVLGMSLPMRRVSAFGLSALAIGATFICPMSPLKANTGYYRCSGDNGGWDRNGILDTRYLVQTHDGSTLFNFDRKRAMPNMPWFDEGLKFSTTADPVHIGGYGPAIGFFAFAAGPNKTIIDTLGLGDPLLARLPTRSTDWGPGHFERKLPDGYEDSVRNHKNLVADRNLHAYYDKLLLATQSPIMGLSRFRAIWDLNFGSANELLRVYAAQH